MPVVYRFLAVLSCCPGLLIEVRPTASPHTGIGTKALQNVVILTCKSPWLHKFVYINIFIMHNQRVIRFCVKQASHQATSLCTIWRAVFCFPSSSVSSVTPVVANNRSFHVLHLWVGHAGRLSIHRATFSYTQIFLILSPAVS